MVFGAPQYPTPDAAQPVRPYSPVVVAGGMIFTAGHVPIRGPDRMPVDGDIGTQTNCVLDNIETTLAAAGASLADVISVRVLLTDPSDVNGMDEVYKTRFKPPYPVRTTCTVRLGNPKFRVEIDVIALAPDASRADR